MQKGVVIDAIKKNESGLERIVVAAPIMVGKQKYFMGVMLQRDAANQRLYAHDVVIEKEPTNISEDILSTTGSPKSGELYISNILLRALNIKPSAQNNANKPKQQSCGNANLEKVNAVLEKQNAKLREDVKELKDLLKIQKSVTGGMKLTLSSVEAVSKKLMRDTHSKGNVSELKALLNTFYEELRRNDSISLEESRELAQPVVEWLHSNMVTEETKQDESAYTYEADLIEQDIFAQVLSSYWDVSTLHTVADVKQAQINKLKAKHNERVAEIKKSFKADLAALKKEHKAEVERVRTQKGGGFGIGLSAARAIAKLHGGSLSAEYENHDTICFTLTI